MLLFLIGCSVVFLSPIESAFGPMVRRSQRFAAERRVQHVLLIQYLDDPLCFYLVTGLLRGLMFAAAAAILVRLIEVVTT